MKISDIMTKEVLAVKSETPILEIAELVSRERIHAVPVVDDDRVVIGLITESDFFLKDSAHLVYIPTFVDFMKAGKIKEEHEENGPMKAFVNAKAKDIMTAPCTTINEETDAQEFIKIVKEKGYNTLPVVDFSGKLAGIITVADVLKLM